MSFLNKIKGWGQDRNAETEATTHQDAPFEAAFDHQHADLQMPDVGGSAALDTAAFETPHTQQHAMGGDSSIITEAAPSELADFGETRMQGDQADADVGSGLPLIGNRPVAQQQRILFAMVGIGLAGLVVMTVTSLISANRGAAQVGASGQALMPSQRLAKSVSQALIGSPQAFPEVRESTEVLAKSVRGLNVGSETLAAAPSGVQDDIQKMLPLVDRAEKNANTVIAQQKILTQVGQALRAINRQSSDLLETAETISSLKLQQEASPAELSAVGQLVMLTQRIGKSANEFLTMEGVSPEAGFLTGKDLNSFREIAQRLADGNQEMRLPGTKDPQTKERLVALLKQYEETRTQAGAILGNLQGLVSAREAQAAIIADSEPLRKGLEAVQEKLGKETGFSGGALIALMLSALLIAAGGSRSFGPAC